MPETTAFAAVIFYRLASFYVPPIWGFFALRWLEKTKQLDPSSVLVGRREVREHETPREGEHRRGVVR